MSAAVDVLIPTCGRPAALAVTLTSLAAQTRPGLRIVVSDQTEGADPLASGEVLAAVRALRFAGHAVELGRHLPRRGLSEHRQSLLDRAAAPYALFLDDDLILEPDLVDRLVDVIARERCGVVGSAFLGLSFLDDERPDEQAIEFWEGPVEPEVIRPDRPEWERWRLHNAANLVHAARAHGLTRTTTRIYKIAWASGCQLWDVEKLRASGGFTFWRELPLEHSGEDVLAQLRVIAGFGGCGIVPSGVYHQELPTTVADRSNDAHRLLPHWLPGSEAARSAA
jgi:GT2 family glycosyltransferase